MFTIDCHVHCGVQDDSAPQGYEDIAPLFDEAGVDAAVCFSPVMEVYDRYDPLFTDNEEWRERRRKSHQYLCGLKNTRHKIYPFNFVWNDFDTSNLENFCGIKWHRHASEPVYNYKSEGCRKMLEKIRELGLVILLEEEYENTVYFVDEIAQGIPIIIPHLGYLNGGIQKLFTEDFWKRDQVYADMSAGGITETEVMTFINKYGPEKLLFGSDYPFGSPVKSKRIIENLKIPDADKKLILSDNILRLIKNS